MRVLTEQEVAARPSASSRAVRQKSVRVRSVSAIARTGIVPGRDRRPSRDGLRKLGHRIQTVFLLLLTAGLAATVVIVVPDLEEHGEGQADGFLHASGPALPELQSGLVDFELTDDIRYLVAEGETLSEIARRHDIEYGELAAYNDLKDPHSIVSGQEIVIPGLLSRRLAAEEE